MGYLKVPSDKNRPALNKIEATLFPHEAKHVAGLMTAISSTKGAESKFKRIAESLNREQLLDYVAEIRFGLIFAGLGFAIEFEPLGAKGPDLVVRRDGEESYLEVKRFRSVPREYPLLEFDENQFELSRFGDPIRDIPKVRTELLGKLGQVRAGSGIVAFWSDNDELEEWEFTWQQPTCTGSCAAEFTVYLPDFFLQCSHPLGLDSGQPGKCFVLHFDEWGNLSLFGLTNWRALR